MAELPMSPWDRREDESASRYARFVEYLQTPPSQRGRLLAGRGRDREWAKQHDWRARAVMFDDAADIEFAQQLREQRRDMRLFHAKVGRALVSFAVAKINAVDSWRPDVLVKLLAEGRKLESAALLGGSDREVESALRSAVAAAGDADLDEWDQLAADLAATMPPPGGFPRS